MHLGEGEWKQVKLEQTEDGVSWGHRYMKQQQDVLAIVEVGCFDLEKVRGMGHEELALVDLGLELASVKQILQPGSIEKIHR